jgi:hypothetical protein
VVIKKSSVEKSQSSFETPAYRDMSLGAEELKCVGSHRILITKELSSEKDSMWI